MLVPYVQSMNSSTRNNPNTQDAIAWHLTRLEAVKQALAPVFHEAIIGELCDFIAPEERLSRTKRVDELIFILSIISVLQNNQKDAAWVKTDGVKVTVKVFCRLVKIFWASWCNWSFFKIQQVILGKNAGKLPISFKWGAHPRLVVRLVEGKEMERLTLTVASLLQNNKNQSMSREKRVWIKDGYKNWKESSFQLSGKKLNSSINTF